jgi:hypothetical protein
MIAIGRPAKGTMPIIAGMIAVAELGAIRAAEQFSAQSRGAAGQDAFEHLALPRRHGGAKPL